ncbi:hypothetical protein B0I37DRAFT_363741 [Chaetomium sp. MPI-CAGE-AT-0009]|nr:hypothetical protein B0I37DRAFT_363741 [Chaetomium sp. MPI-CAGE-AT-0009]
MLLQFALSQFLYCVFQFSFRFITSLPPSLGRWVDNLGIRLFRMTGESACLAVAVRSASPSHNSRRVQFNETTASSIAGKKTIRESR